MSKIKITIFGEGIKIKRLYLPDHIIFDWKEKTGLKQIDLSDKIIDSFFFHDLKHTQYKSLDDIPSKSISGMLDK